MSKQVTAWVAPEERHGFKMGSVFLQEKEPIKDKDVQWKGDGYTTMLNNWAMHKLGLADITEPTKITITIED